MLHEHYPTPAEVDDWCAGLWRRAEAVELAARVLDAESYAFQLAVRHTSGNHYVEFTGGGLDRFYGYWQPATGGAPAPTLVHLPGYAHEMSAHPELVAEGFNVLHVSPLGYATPDGPDESKRMGDSWPVLPETVLSLGERGYVDWLASAAAAVRWALGLEGVDARRLGVFGSSNGGGTAALLTSVLSAGGVEVGAVAADVIFLTNFPDMVAQLDPGAYWLAKEHIEHIAAERPGDAPAAWRALGFVDTLSHAHRLTMPVMLTAGTEDTVCPPDSVRSLFECLPGTRSYTELAGQAHGYTVPFLRLASAWFRTYV